MRFSIATNLPPARRRKYMAAWRKHEASARNLEKAARDVERFQTCLFVALKHQEKMVAAYNVTAKAKSKFDR